jgi:DNA-binding response OmpR family regulator
VEAKTILIADDEKEIIELLTLYLEKDGYKVIEAYNGIMALEKMEEQNVDIALIDLMMPEMDGYTLLKNIRKMCNIPVIILSAKDDFNNRILGLDLGADDYVVKPFNPLEILARVRANLRRYEKSEEQKNKLDEEETQEKLIINIKKLSINTKDCSVYINENEVQLTSTEYKLLVYLSENAGRVFTKKQIFEHVWDEPYFGDDNTIMVHISNLRDKIEADPKNPEYIKTIRGLGYKLEK